MQELRIYFPLLTARQLVLGVNTAYSQEIRKLRNFGIKYITPYLSRLKLRKYPFKIHFIYYTADEIDMISAITMSSYILHLFEKHVTLQSTDYRVLSNINILIQKVQSVNNEGCKIIFEPIQASCTDK